MGGDERAAAIAGAAARAARTRSRRRSPRRAVAARLPEATRRAAARRAQPRPQGGVAVRVGVPGAVRSGHPDIEAYFAAKCRPISPEPGSFLLMTALLLADITFVSKAICRTMVANALVMNVRTFGSLLLRLSHQRNGLSTQPPSVVPRLPSKLPVCPPNRSTSACDLQQSCPVSRPLAGMPARLNSYASVPTGDRNSCFSPIESKYDTASSRATVDAL